MDCLQNVFSKKLLSSDHPYSPPELQFYTSAAAIAVQLPFWFFMEWPSEVKLTDNKFLIFIFLLNGFMFYMQSLTAFGLMSLISPVAFRYISMVLFIVIFTIYISISCNPYIYIFVFVKHI